MGNRVEAFRKQILDGGGPATRHSMNQKTIGCIIQMQEKGFDHKAAKAEDRRSRHQQFVQDYLQTFQFTRALEHILDGNATNEDIDYVLRNIHVHEQKIDRFRIRRSNGNGEARITGVTTTIVDFTRRPQEPLH